MKVDVAIVGGGPAGLAVALEAALQGASVCVLEQGVLPVDKACGEGVMPTALAALDRLGVLALLDRRQCAPFERVVWVQEDGRQLEIRLPSPGGLGIRRTALVSAMVARAQRLPVTIRQRCRVRDHHVGRHNVVLDTSDGRVEATLLVAADGLHSPIRRALGLELSAPGPRRFGLRRHARLAPWAARVEVHLAADAEAYVTPAGDNRIGIAVLWDDGRVKRPVSFDALLARFPALARRLRGVPWDSLPRGAGPFLQRAAGLASDRVMLVGDAAGYVDAITGEGLSLAFEGAAILGEELPRILAHEASRASLAAYEQRMQAAFRGPARFARLLVWTTARPRLRRLVVNRLATTPWLVEQALGLTQWRGSRRPPGPAAG